jgi:hypothetical protein
MKKKEMYTIVIRERLIALSSAYASMTKDYRHVFEEDEPLCKLIKKEIDALQEELDSRH